MRAAGLAVLRGWRELPSLADLDSLSLQYPEDHAFAEIAGFAKAVGRARLTIGGRLPQQPIEFFVEELGDELR